MTFRFITCEQLDVASTVPTLLDEHRALVEGLLRETDYLANPNFHPWRVSHLATQDDYLMYLFFLRYQIWPQGSRSRSVIYGSVRDRPEILGHCGHPAYSHEAALKLDKTFVSPQAQSQPKSFFRWLGFRSQSSINPEQLDFAFDVSKRLDEHREVVEDLLRETDYLAELNVFPLRSVQLATLDDYLMYICFLRHQIWPLGPNSKHCEYHWVRDRPEILGPCGHQAYAPEIAL